MRYLWTVDGEAHRIIRADNEDKAHKKAIQLRMEENEQTREEAEGWFDENDALILLDGVEEVQA